MKKTIFTLLYIIGSVPVVMAQSTQNYVKSQVRNTNNSLMTTYQYYDDMGRPFEKVEVGVTPSNTNLVWLTDYDGIGRESKAWLPYVSGSAYVAGSTVRTSTVSSYSDSNPYSQIVYETSPLNRVTAVKEQGQQWHLHPKQTEYLHNTDTYPLNCKNYTVNVSGTLNVSGNYLANTLSVRKLTDEDSHIVYEFRDKQGRLILQRQMLNTSSSADTYYAYDYRGDLRYVLQPEYQNNADLSLFAFQYKYDARHNVIEKKLPGADPVKYAYDKANRQIYAQDGVQRQNNHLTFMLYDIQGRLVLQGNCYSTSMPNVSSSFVTVIRGTIGGIGSSGYTTNISLSSPVVEQVHYYDDFIFRCSALGFANPAYTAGTVSAKGLETGSRIATLEATPTNCYAVYNYDIKGRIVKTVSSNQMSGLETVTTTYGYTDQPLTVTHVHSAAGFSDQTEVLTYTYDQADRMKTVTHKLNSNAAVTLKNNTYDSYGRLSTSKLMNCETVTYTYNIRNWLNNISSTNFTENLFYYDAPSQCFNGNISRLTWKQTASSTIRGYDFVYDKLNRLTSATYGEAASLQTNKNRYSTSYTYDKNGNFLTLVRKGLQDNNTYGFIDNLTFTNNGNQVIDINDSASDPTYNGAFNFNDSISLSNDYAYDKNGNLTKDSNKKISSIQYNSLNLPSIINYSDGKYMEYVYSATGEKRSVTYNVLMAGGNYTYCDNFIYYNGYLSQILVDGGYISFNGSTPTYYYYLKDHLGSNRVTMRTNGTVVNVSHYYPFGGLFGESTGISDMAYKYNGKEFERLIGLDWYDYGARHMDCMRFTTMDPMAEKYYNVSPYAYCLNNPVKFCDLEGTDPGDYFESMDLAALDFGKFYNDKSIRKNKEFSSNIYKTKDSWGNTVFSYTIPNEGENDESIPTEEGMPQGSKVVARVHSHGSWDKDYVNSAGDGNEIFSESDKKVYQRLQIYGYVSTPKGKMLKWDPNDRTSIIISDKMPKDPKTVNKNERFIKSYKHSKESTFQKRRDEWYRKKSQESLIDKLLSIIIKGK